jgi:uncharacterized protein YbjT (DUF2867 family)
MKSILVTGAGGRTGGIVVRKLLQDTSYQVRALVRSDKSAQALVASLGLALGCSSSSSPPPKQLQIVLGDVSRDSAESLSGHMQGASAVVVTTSAAPQVDYWSLPRTVFRRLVLRDTTARPDFWYPTGQTPEVVDWVGQRAQVDAAGLAGVGHVVLVGSMGGTQPTHFLNTMGKGTMGTGGGGGNILLWKRKAEKHLIASGLDYTIIHPGGLLPTHPPSAAGRLAAGGSGVPAGGERELLVGVDDSLLLLDPSHRSLPREDVAEVVVQALSTPSALNRSFDLASKPPPPPGPRRNSQTGRWKAPEARGGGGKCFTSLDILLEGLDGANCQYESPPLLHSSL